MSRIRVACSSAESGWSVASWACRAASSIRAICDAGTTVLLVEQKAFAALELCDYAYLLETGRIVLAGPGATLIADPHVRQAYLGG